MCQDEIKYTFSHSQHLLIYCLLPNFRKMIIKNKRIQNRLNDMKMKFSNLKF